MYKCEGKHKDDDKKENKKVEENMRGKEKE